MSNLEFPIQFFIVGRSQITWRQPTPTHRRTCKLPRRKTSGRECNPRPMLATVCRNNPGRYPRAVIAISNITFGKHSVISIQLYLCFQILHFPNWSNLPEERGQSLCGTPKVNARAIAHCAKSYESSIFRAHVRFVRGSLITCT